MNYDDLLDLARRQDVPEDVGPPFEALLAAAQTGTAAAGAAGAATGGRTALWWILGGLAAAATVTAIVARPPARPAADPVSTDQVPAEVAPAPATPAAGPPTPPPDPDRAAPHESPAATPATVPNDGAAETPTRARSHRAARPRTRPERAARPDPEALYREAEAHLAAGRRREARRVLRALVRAFPAWSGHATALFDLAHLEEQLGATSRAYCTYRRLLAEHGRDPLAGEARRAVERLRPKAGQTPCGAGTPRP